MQSFAFFFLNRLQADHSHYHRFLSIRDLKTSESVCISLNFDPISLYEYHALDASYRYFPSYREQVH